MDICLVNMPFADLKAPSIALGLLQAALERENISASSFYANLFFAEQIGLEDYYFPMLTRSEDGLADWFFARAAFPEFIPEDDAYIRMVKEKNRSLRRFGGERLRETFLRMRNETGVFIERMAARILDRRPRMVGCTTSLQQHVASLALLRRIRAMAPEVITIMGGAACESVMGRTTHRSFPWVDFVVSGDGDELIGRLVLSILQKGRDIASRGLPEGVFAPIHRSAGYPVMQNGGPDDAPRAMVRSLDELPLPEYRDYFTTLQALELGRKISPVLLFESSRGCWWGQKKGCTFCGLNGKGKKYRSKKPESVLGQMQTLSVKHGIGRFECVDNVLDMDYFQTVLKDLRSMGSPYRIFYETKSNLNRQQVKDLRGAGVIGIQPGIESFDSRVLALIHKGSEAWNHVQLLKWCRQNGVFAIWRMLYAFPGEEDEWYLEMASLLPLLTHLQPPIMMGPVIYQRYSHYHLNPGAYGLRLHPTTSSSFIFPLTEDELSEQVYFFEDELRVNYSRDPVHAILLGRAGIAAIAGELSEWMRLFKCEDPPILNMTDFSSALHIRDTRPTAAASSFVINGIEREVYLACDDGPKVEVLKKSFAEKGIDEEEIISIVEGFLEKKLLMRLDGRLIALALQDPVVELPKPGELPLSDSWLR